ncbi:MAG: hypothetical protein D6732_18265 [Methanobacteriota archaeon]|nr:MAG: hypothetical protein D6732_18265 [Euryarchaeota archaeon]
MNIFDYPGLILLAIFIIIVAVAIYKDAKSSKPVYDVSKIHTITQGSNLLNANVENDNRALKTMSEKNRGKNLE